MEEKSEVRQTFPVTFDALDEVEDGHEEGMTGYHSYVQLERRESEDAGARGAHREEDEKLLVVFADTVVHLGREER